MTTIRRVGLLVLFTMGLSGIGATLAAQTAVPCAAPVGTPPTPSVTASPPDLVVSWKKVARATGYGVVRRNPDGNCWSITPQGTTATSWRDPMPTTAGTYDYQVGVRYTSGQFELSQWTSYVVGTAPVAAPTSAPPPTNVTVTGTPTTAKLTWGAPKGAVNYRVNRAVAGTTAWTSLTPTPITTTSIPNDVLPDPAQTYTYSVIAYQRNGQYGEARVDFKAPPPTNPVGLVGSAAGTTVSLLWQPVQYASGYLASGPGISGTVRTTTTSYSLTAPEGSNVYRVGAVFDPGNVQTSSSVWPSVTVAVQAPPPPATCACATTGPFTYGALRTVVGTGPSGSFTHPSAGTFTLTAQSLGQNSTLLDVLDSRGSSVLSEGNAYNWALSPDNRFFVVVYPPASTNSGAIISVFLIQLGPARWPRIVDAVAWPDGFWGFGGNTMFVIVRSVYPGTNFSFEAYNLLSQTPNTAVLRVAETNVRPADPQSLMYSPCGDRLMYYRYIMGGTGQADFYRRTSFGAAQTPVIADYDATVPGLPGAAISGYSNNFLVVLSSLRERSTGLTNFPSLQCTP